MKLRDDWRNEIIKRTRPILLSFLLILAEIISGSPAGAAEKSYPTKPVNLIVPFPPVEIQTSPALAKLS